MCAKCFDDQGCKPRDTGASGLDHQVSDFAIPGFPSCQKFFEPFVWLGTPQHWPVAVASRARRELKWGCSQIDCDAACLKRSACCGILNCTASGCEHDVAFLRQLVKQQGFSPPEASLALDIEDDRDSDAATRLKLTVGIDETFAHPIRKLASDGALAGPHEANEEEVP
jgi:hypothetical protein